MKDEASIRRILTEELGFVDLAAYRHWVTHERPKVKLTPERLELLNPDAIDCRAFWRVSEALFGRDPVANQVVPTTHGSAPSAANGAGADEMDANRQNLHFARSMGITAFLDEFAHERVRTLEIGPGFGALKHYIETRTNHRYVGVDVFPRIPDVLEATAAGLLPEPFVQRERGRFSYVVSSNVFQHLSAKQRTRYYVDARELLHDGGLFCFNLTVDHPDVPPYVRDAHGAAWCDHYGQYTLMPKPPDLQRELSGLFTILYVTHRHDGVVNFVCQRR